MTGNFRPGLAASSPWMGRADGGEIPQLHEVPMDLWVQVTEGKQEAAAWPCSHALNTKLPSTGYVRQGKGFLEHSDLFVFSPTGRWLGWFLDDPTPVAW